MSRKRVMVGVGVSVGATLGSAGSAEALTYQVDNTGDSGAATTCDIGTAGDCSLRQAVDVANSTSAPDVITFQSSVTGAILVTGGALSPTYPLQINGPGAATLALDANDTDTIFMTNPPEDGSLQISGLTLRDGSYLLGGAIYNGNSDKPIIITDSVLTLNEAGNAGAIYSAGDLTLDRTQVTNNMATTGNAGGITTFGDSLTLTDSTLSGNRALLGLGGGIYQPGGGQLTITRSTISGNDAEAVGGVGIQTGSLEITDSTITDNESTEFDGGGVRIVDTNTAIITRSTVSGNTSERGGGIATDGSVLDLINSTVFGNRAVTPGATGGGLHVRSTSGADVVTISNSTISGNSAVGNGGGAYFDGSGGAPAPELSNTIVANNTGASGRDLFGGWEAGFSLIESTAGASITPTVAGSNLTGADPLLGPLADNGGETRTHLLSPASPAIDAGATAVATDQRGRPRPFDVPAIGNSGAGGADGADIGAVELTRGEAVLCAGRQPTIVAGGRVVRGTAKADVILGTPGRNVIRGRGGRDRLCGLGGRDTLIGGGGGDTLIGGAGRDTLRGGPGRDKLKGGPGRDIQRQ